MRVFFRILIAVVVCFFVLLIGVIIIVSRSSQGGAEFSPDDFSLRHFSYVKEPFTGWVLAGKKLSNYSITGLDLVADGFIQPTKASPKTWYLIYDDHDSTLQSKDCDARLLVDYLQLTTDRSENVWAIWNSDHPKLAKTFWPVVAEMARDELFLVISDVMEFGLESTDVDVDNFVVELNQVVSVAYLKAAQVEFELKNFSTAKKLANKSNAAFASTDAKTLLIELSKQ